MAYRVWLVAHRSILVGELSLTGQAPWTSHLFKERVRNL